MAPNLKTGLVLAGLGLALGLTACEDPPIDSSQSGYRGVAMVQHYNPEDFTALIAANQVPEPQSPAPEGGDLAKDVYQNVEVLGDLHQAEFTRLMNAITQWVSPDEGCAYCHNLAEGFAYEDVYQKKVSRMMIRMTMDINENWEDHVQSTDQQTGVTCYTCHRGNNVPKNVWFLNEPKPQDAQMVGWSGGYQNAPNERTALSSLPGDPFEQYLLGDSDLTTKIRVQGDTVLPNPVSNDSVQATEATYGFMMHQSDSLGVNCTYCHNSRVWSSWEQSPPQRVTAWHGIRMTRTINNDWILPTEKWLPDNRLGPMGDTSKVNCATCHNGVYKPLFGANMVKDYPSLDPNLSDEAAAELRETLGPDHGADYGLPEPVSSKGAVPTSDSIF
jgi:photosynthetic reaction center cytochrome c subunit